MAKADRRLFRPFDIVFPILPSALLCTACIYVATLTGNPARWISILAGITILLIGTAGWYYARSAFTHADYITKHGIYVVLGKTNRPSKELVEEWTDQCLNFWSTKSLQIPDEPIIITRGNLLKAVRNVRCFFHDKKKVNTTYRMIRGIKTKFDFIGIARNDIQIVVGYWPDVPQHGVPGIYRHELSHIILSLNGHPPGPNYGMNHHQIYARVGLGV